MKKELIEYQDNGDLLEAYVSYNDSKTHKRPAVLVAHDWSGKNAFSCEKADQLAQLGYVGFALDMFGKGINGETKEEKSALIQPFMQDRQKLKNRMLAALETLKKIEVVDTNNIAVLGFCFGGLCALDLARSGANIKGAISFHGLFMPPSPAFNQVIKAKILALHGFDDPMANPEQAIAFGREMTEAGANWELDLYGHTLHAFTNPKANDHAFGTVFNQQAAKRSWQAMQLFLSEIFA